MRIGVISDTHIPGRAREIPAEVLAAFSGADLILHAGDVVAPAVLETLRALAPVEAVVGNNDKEFSDLPVTRLLEVSGYRIGLAHGHVGTGKTTVERALSHFAVADCVVFGHSHVAYCQYHGKTLALNPGSATDRRRSPQCSYGMLYAGPDGLRAEIRYIERA